MSMEFTSADVEDFRVMIGAGLQFSKADDGSAESDSVAAAVELVQMGVARRMSVHDEQPHEALAALLMVSVAVMAHIERCGCSLEKQALDFAEG